MSTRPADAVTAWFGALARRDFATFWRTHTHDMRVALAVDLFRSSDPDWPPAIALATEGPEHSLWPTLKILLGSRFDADPDQYRRAAARAQTAACEPMSSTRERVRVGGARWMLVELVDGTWLVAGSTYGTTIIAPV